MLGGPNVTILNDLDLKMLSPCLIFLDTKSEDKTYFSAQATSTGGPDRAHDGVA